MSISLKKNITPITQIQTHISDFLDNLKPFCNLLEEKLEDIKNSKKSEDSKDEFVLLPGNLVRLRNEKCRVHDIPLTKNGTDNRTVYTSEGHIFQDFKVQRYRCKKCGEYKPNYGDFIPKNANYQEEVKAKARHFLYLGNTPGEVVKIFQKNGRVVPSESSVRNWVKDASEEIHVVVKNVKLPTSGYFGYDEIFLRTNKKKAYALNMVDLENDFYVNAQFSQDRKNKSIIQSFRSAMRGGKMKLKGIVFDGAKNYGSLLKKRGFTHVHAQRCQPHYKKNLNEALYEAAGLGKQLKKDLPEPYGELKKALFAVFNRSTLARAERQLALAEWRFYGKISEKIDKIIDDFYQLFPVLFKHHVDRRLTRTNNATERMNLALEKYPSLKKHMKTGAGVDMILDGMVFLHNFEMFQAYILKTKSKISELEQNIAAFLDDKELKSLKRGLKIHLSWVRKDFGKFKEVYLRYFKLNHEVFIVE
jgi:transposase-like protein